MKDQVKPEAFSPAIESGKVSALPTLDALQISILDVMVNENNGNERVATGSVSVHLIRHACILALTPLPRSSVDRR